MAESRFKQPQLEQSDKVKVTTEQLLDKEDESPIFCFKYLHTGYSINKLDKKGNHNLIKQLYLLSQTDWKTIDTAQRHGLGYEKIPIAQINIQPKITITEDVKNYLAFRYEGKKPFLALRRKNILHLLFIDYKMDLYDHE